MRPDITRQPVSFVLLQFFLLLGLFCYRYVFYPAAPELLSPDTGGLLDPVTWTLSMPGSYVPPGEIINALAVQFPIIGLALSALLIFAGAYSITKVMAFNLLFPTTTYLSYIFYLLTACGIWFAGANLSAIISAYLIIRACGLFMSSFVRNDSFGITFRAALLLGTVPLLYPLGAIYILLMPVAMVIFMRSGREAIVCWFGAVLPAMFTAYIVWALGGGFTQLFIGWWEDAVSATGGIPVTNSLPDILRVALAAVIVIQLIFSLLSLLAMRDSMRTRSKKIHTFMLWFLLLAITAMLLPSRNISELYIAAIPIAFLSPAFYIKRPGKMSLIVYLALILLAVGLNLAPILL